MARIKIEDLPQNMKISREEMKKIVGGYGYEEEIGSGYLGYGYGTGAETGAEYLGKTLDPFNK